MWDFAIEISSLVAAGHNVNDLRWLSAAGYVEHAVEVSRSKDTSRRFQRSNNLGFHPRTCFVLTPAGIRAAKRWASPGPRHAGTLRCFTAPAIEPAADADLLPSWDADRRILRLGNDIVKQFHVPAQAQEAVLQAFEEDGWPPAIDDPLPPEPEQCPKRRLRATLQRLNGGQINRLLNFRGDGSGERIVWELKVETCPRQIVHQVRRLRAA